MNTENTESKSVAIAAPKAAPKGKGAAERQNAKNFKAAAKAEAIAVAAYNAETAAIVGNCWDEAHKDNEAFDAALHEALRLALEGKATDESGKTDESKQQAQPVVSIGAGRQYKDSDRVLLVGKVQGPLAEYCKKHLQAGTFGELVTLCAKYEQPKGKVLSAKKDWGLRVAVYLVNRRKLYKISRQAPTGV